MMNSSSQISNVINNFKNDTSFRHGSIGVVRNDSFHNRNDTNKITSGLEMITQLNNKGVSCMKQSQLSRAKNYFQRSLEKSNEMAFLTMPFDDVRFRCCNHHQTKNSMPNCIGKTNNEVSYDEGMTTYLTPISIKYFGCMDLNISNYAKTILFNLGILYLRLEQDDNDKAAYDCFKQAMDIVLQQQQQQQKKNTNNIENLLHKMAKKKIKEVGLVEILHNIGYIQYRRCQYEEAIKTYKSALCILRESSSLTNSNSNTNYCQEMKIATTLNCLGVVKYRMEDKDNANTTTTSTKTGKTMTTSATTAAETAEQALLESVQIQQRNTANAAAASYGTENCEYSSDALFATTLNNLGRVYDTHEKYEDARDIYYQVLDIRRRVYGTDYHLDVAATIYNIAQTLYNLKDFDGAMEYYEKFLVLTKNHHCADHHRDVTNVLKCMAQIYHTQKQYDKAKLMYKKALFVGKATLGQYHEEVANTLNKLGNLLYEIGDYDAALTTYKQGLSIEQKVLDASDPNIVVTLTNIGQIYKLRGNYREALKAHKEAIKIQRRFAGKFGDSEGKTKSPNPDICITLLSIAAIHYEAQNYMKALQTYEEVLQVQRDIYNENDNSDRNDDNSDSKMQQNNKSSHKSHNRNHVEVASTLNSIGLVFFKMELHEYALQAFKESLNIRQSLLGRNHGSVAIILYNIGTVHLEMGDDEAALLYYNETLRVERQTFGNNHEDVALTLEHIGFVYQHRGEFDEAIQYLSEALEIHYYRNDNNTKNNQKQQHNNSNDRNNNNHNAAAISIAQTLNHIGNIYLQKGDGPNLVTNFAKTIRYLRQAGQSDDELKICGMNYYSISKMHPECAPIA